MGPQKRLFPKAYAKELLKLANLDLESAKVLQSASGLRKDPALFLVQQAIEKALKSVLCFSGIAIPLTHDLYALVLLLEQIEVPPGGFDLHDLTPYATIRRYEEGSFEPTPEDVEVALNAADLVLKWAKKKIAHG